MNEFVKVLRWAVPGAIFVGFFLGMVAVERALSSNAKGFLMQIDASRIALVSLLSVPLGFVLYQAYFFRESNASRLFDRVTTDSGRRVLDRLHDANRFERVTAHGNGGPLDASLARRKGLRFRLHRGSAFLVYPTLCRVAARLANPVLGWATQFLLTDTLAKEGATYADAREYYRFRERNWTTLEAMIARVSSTHSSERAEQQIDRLAEIYHTLGASRTAGFWGLISAALWLLVGPGLSRERPWDVSLLGWTLAAGGLAFGVFAAFWYILQSNRAHCMARREDVIFSYLASAGKKSKNWHPVMGAKGHVG